MAKLTVAGLRYDMLSVTADFVKTISPPVWVCEYIWQGGSLIRDLIYLTLHILSRVQTPLATQARLTEECGEVDQIMPENDNYWLSWLRSSFHTNYCFVMGRDCKGMWGRGEISPVLLKTLDYNWQVTVCLFTWWVDYSLPWLPLSSPEYLEDLNLQLLAVISVTRSLTELAHCSSHIHKVTDSLSIFPSYICKGLADSTVSVPSCHLLFR